MLRGGLRELVTSKEEARSERRDTRSEHRVSSSAGLESISSTLIGGDRSVGVDLVMNYFFRIFQGNPRIYKASFSFRPMTSRLLNALASGGR